MGCCVVGVVPIIKADLPIPCPVAVNLKSHGMSFPIGAMKAPTVRAANNQIKVCSRCYGQS